MEVDDRFMVAEEGCRTPRRDNCQIPAVMACPPAPRKKPAFFRQQNPPKEGYFQPPDLEVLFAIPPRREACAN
ncbi:hypothetical protein NMG60_11012440 [Bertholletia excelsa]